MKMKVGCIINWLDCILVIKSFSIDCFSTETLYWKDCNKKLYTDIESKVAQQKGIETFKESFAIDYDDSDIIIDSECIRLESECIRLERQEKLNRILK